MKERERARGGDRRMASMASATEGPRVGRQGPKVGRVGLQVSLSGGRACGAPLGFSTTCRSAPAEVCLAPRLLYPFAEASCETA
jgi:hypothetical protein